MRVCSDMHAEAFLVMREIVKGSKTLSDETRLRVLNLIMDRECCVCEVMQALDISQSKASRALSSLYNAGFLKLRKQGLWSLYSLEKETLSGCLLKMVEAVELALATNQLAIQDKQRLGEAVRTGTGCNQKSDGPEICFANPKSQTNNEVKERINLWKQ
jgi:ArsR family transcriptional regulator, arsenate/arsenite/antimonite-responsive transcriptional repressor